MPTVLTVNSGSSSLKAALFHPDCTRRDFRYEKIGGGSFHDHGAAFDALLSDLGGAVPDAIGHRFVHGGETADPARLLTASETVRLEKISHLAPLHMPGNLLGAHLCAERFPHIPQVACFDTSFHATIPEVAWRLPIPREYGLRRYGFHGLNFSHIARTLPGLLGEAAHGKIVVAHLGAGCSLCLLDDLKSMDTTMGYSPAGGLVMGTRSGDLDPGVMLELAARHTPEELSRLVYRAMGLLALSDGESSEMSVLLTSGTPAAALAVEKFCRRVQAGIGAYAAVAGGLDGLIFTAGIGERSAIIRSKICEPLGSLGFQLDAGANERNETFISATGSKPVLRVPADEEAMIRDLTLEIFADPVQRP